MQDRSENHCLPKGYYVSSAAEILFDWQFLGSTQIIITALPVVDTCGIFAVLVTLAVDAEVLTQEVRQQLLQQVVYLLTHQWATAGEHLLL